jgi:hypothetical protein
MVAEHDDAWDGPRASEVRTPALPVGGVRRTTSIDSHRPGGPGAPIVVQARARDAVRTDEGWHVEDEAAFDLTVEGYFATLLSVDAQPAGADLRPLVGSSLRGGLRARLADLVPTDVERRSALHTLLDDLPGAMLVTGYGSMRAEPEPLRMPDEHVDRSADQCAGWAEDGIMVTLLRRDHVMPISYGAAAPDLASADGDPDAWHPLGPLHPHSMRRRRRIDVRPDGTVEAFFRDSHVDADGFESALHEYTVDVVVDLEAGVAVSAAARAGALPWRECPAALASAGRIAGLPLADLRNRVRAEFVGTSTCTHLNDTLRALADVPVLAAGLRFASSPRS